MAGALAASAFLLGNARAQQFTNVSSTNLPPLGSATEATKFADLDLDGDLDLVYANGGDANNQQSRVLFNQGLSSAGGGALGTIGVYIDRTTTNLTPNFTQSSRDVQIVDIDNDGDFDFYFSNHSQGTNQSNTWFVNQGLAQGGTAGVFIRDMSRWNSLGISGSSIPAAQVINSGNFAGGFVDWSCQCDFADADLDGDTDLLHSSYGPGFNAAVMTRLFLNIPNPNVIGGGSGKGEGFFREYNPSNAISPNPSLNEGNAAGFVEGTQQANTANTAGQFHDITNMSLDVDFGDMDGDFDIDIYANSRDTRQRFYQNRYFENGGGLGSEGSGTRLYRDVTNAWAPNLTDASANYDGDINDMDNDNDIDGYFLNGGGGTTDVWALNNGTGLLGVNLTVPNSGNDDNEIDWHDFDNDGDIDPFVSAFSGSDRLYKNQFVETGNIDLIQVTGVASGVGSSTLGSDIGDMDNDGDTDVICAEDGGVNEVLLRNNLNIPDPIAPRIPNVQALANGPATSTARRVLARVFDNVNLEYFHHATGSLNFTVDGNPVSSSLFYAGGNIWRGEIPGYWHGTIGYSVSVTDRGGNTGTSSTQNVIISPVGLASFGTGVNGCSGAHAISANSSPALPNPDFQVRVTNCPPSTTQLMLVSNVAGLGNDDFGIGIPMWVSLFAPEVYAFDLAVNASGTGIATVPLPGSATLSGVTYHWQAIVANTACVIAPFNLSSSGALSTTLFQ